MAIKSRVVLPYLVPQLTAPPTNTKALAILASVAGEALNKQLPRILPALQTAISTSKGTPEEAQVSKHSYVSKLDLSPIENFLDLLNLNIQSKVSLFIHDHQIDGIE